MTKAPSGYTFSNANALTYYTALQDAGFTDAQSQSVYGLSADTVAEAIDTFFITLVTDSIYSKMTWMYPIIGGTAGTHAINAVNPGTNDMTWVNSPTHSATGVDGDGATTYGKSGIIPNDDFTENDIHASGYSREDSAGGNKMTMSCSNSTPQWFHLFIKDGVNYAYFTAYSRSTGAGRVLYISATDATGFWIGTRATELEMYRNGSSVATQAGTSGTMPTYELYFLGQNSAGTPNAFNDREHCFLSVGNDLTDTDASNFSTAVNTLQTTLGRNIY